ncbi:MAG: hypothetical protein QXL67_05265 [Candidatus Bathyarchaeia archaeon]
MKISEFYPAFTLLFLAPLIGSLLSASSPPLEFFNPPNFFFLSVLYGGGAIIARELRRRWNKGIVSLLFLGAAYGVLEEGLIVGSFFNPGLTEATQFSLYGRWMEINWVWTEMLIIYHSIYSITIPVLLVELAYPKKKFEKWFSDLAFKLILVFWSSFLAFGFYKFSIICWVTPSQLIFVISLTSIFIYLSYKTPSDWLRFGGNDLPNPIFFWIVGAFGSFLFFLGFIFLPLLFASWVAGMLLGPLLILLFGFLLKRYNWKKDDELQRLYLIGGALTFFIVFSPLLELAQSEPGPGTGMSLVGLSALIGLLLFRRNLKRRMEREAMSKPVEEEYPVEEGYEYIEKVRCSTKNGET